MKKNLLVLSVFITIGLKAQYTFSQFNDVYTPLNPANDLFDALPNWDDDLVNIAIGFPFSSFGTLYDSIGIESNGTVFLNNNFSSIDFNVATDTFVVLMPFGEFISQHGTIDLMSRDIGTSPIVYELQGTTGSRIAKIEWQNAGFYNDPTGGEDSISFQCWIYEADGSIEFRYGTSQVSAASLDGSTGPNVGIAHYYLNPDFDFASGSYLTGNPVAATVTNAYSQLNGVPPANKVYRWAHSSVGISEPANTLTNFSVYPNPANDVATIVFTASSSTTIKVTDVTGKIVREETVPATGFIQYQLNTTDLNAGVYFVSLNNTVSNATKKIVIQK